jgi:GT2 family glycosyltransferase
MAAAPRAPLTVIKAFWWYATRRRVRARNRLQEIVGRRLGFAIPPHLRKIPAPSPPARGLRWAAIVPCLGDVPMASLRTTLASIPPGVEATVAIPANPPPGQYDARVIPLPGATSVATLVDAAAASCDHDALMILHPGSILLPGGLALLDAALSDEATDAAFADEVLALPDLTLPLLKPDFDEDLLLQVDFVGPFLAIRRDVFLSLGGYAPGREGSLARDFLLRLAAARGDKAIGHVLGAVHGRDLRGETPPCPPAARHLGPASEPGTPEAVDTSPPPGNHAEIVRVLPAPPPVSVIVPTRDRPDLFVPCLDGLLHGTDYPHLEVLVADNDSREPGTLARFAEYDRDPRVRIVPMPGPFNFSRINNEAVAQASGRVVVFMNNDVEVLGADWLMALVAEAIRPEVGAVGAKLLYPGGLVQHAGVVLGLMGGPAGHAFHLFRDGHPGYLHMLEATRRCSAVTAACLAVERTKFEALGGFDTEAFPVALNDVDLCLRLDRAGYRNLYVPKACLLHKESASRPSDWHPEQRARYERELAAFKERWADRLDRDPWYNRGHGQANADFSVPRWTGTDWPPPPC